MSKSRKRLFATLMSSAGALGAGFVLARWGIGTEFDAHMRSAMSQASSTATGLVSDAAGFPAVATAHLTAAATALHSWISTPLMWIAAPFLAAAAMSRAVHGESGERLAFGALAVACFGFAFENLLIVHAPDPAALAQLADTRLQLSAMSNVLLGAFPLLMCFRLEPDEKSLAFLKNLWNFVIPLLGTAGIVVIAIGPSTHVTKEMTAALANDEIISTAAWIASGAGLTGWARKYGVWTMIAMGACACAVAVPQFRYYEGNVLLLDLMRAGGATMALIVALVPLPGRPKGSNTTASQVDAAEPAAS
jgi:hypothetical protein